MDIRYRNWLAAGLAGATIAYTAGMTPARAEDPVPAPELAQSAESAETTDDANGPIRMGPISVTATRNEIDPFIYPGMVTVIGGEELDLLNPSTPDDALKLVPNVEFTGGPRRSGEAPSIRGFSGPDVVVLIDGTRQNNDSAHNGRFFLDPVMLRQVEVLRGPASSLYGSGGTGGVMEFRTARAEDFLEPGEQYGVTVSGGYQDAYDEWLAGFTAYTKPAENVDLIASISNRNSGTIQLGNGEELDNSDDDILSALVKGGVEFAEHHRLEASILHFKNNATEPNNGQGLGSADQVDKDISTDTFRLAYNFSDPGNDLIDLDAQVYYTRFSTDEQRLDNLGSGPQGELLKRDVDTIGMRLDNRSRVMLGATDEVTFTYGVEAYRDEQDGGSASGERDGVPDAVHDFAGIFAQAELDFGMPLGAPGRLLVIPGVRYDHYEATSDLATEDTVENRLSPRLGVSYLPQDWLLFFANYAEAFRAPTMNELYLTGTHFQIPIGPGITNSFVPNPDLKPQSTQTVEFGAGLDFDDIVTPRDNFRIKATHFRIWGADFIDLAVNQPEPFIDCNPFIPGACDGTTTSTNVPKAKLWGTEVEAAYENHRFLIGLGYSDINGEDADTGEKLGVLTPATYTANLAVKIPEIDSLLGWRAIYAEKFDKTDDPAEERDAYDTHDIYFAWAPADGPLEGVRVDLGIDNLFDENYARVYTDAPEAGRNFKARVSYSLKW